MQARVGGVRDSGACVFDPHGRPGFSVEQLARDAPQLGGVHALEMRLAELDPLVGTAHSLVPPTGSAVGRGGS